MSFNPPQDRQDAHPYYTHNGYGHYISDGSTIGTGEGDESSFWSNSPRSDSPSPNSALQVTPYQMYSPVTYSGNNVHIYRTGYQTTATTEADCGTNVAPPFVRVVKRRTTANKKERRRTQSINNAYADLRDCIPNVPADTKLSKIKTLRLATSYISYLTRALESDDPAGGFKAELGSISRKNSNNPIQVNDCTPGQNNPPKGNILTEDNMSNGRKAKGRTGWPQHVWALELKQEQGM